METFVIALEVPRTFIDTAFTLSPATRHQLDAFATNGDAFFALSPAGPTVGTFGATLIALRTSTVTEVVSYGA